MDYKISKEQIEDVLHSWYKASNVRKDRTIKLMTGTQGMSQFQKALEFEYLHDAIDNSKFNESQKTNLRLLLSSNIEEDRVILKEMLNAELK